MFRQFKFSWLVFGVFLIIGVVPGRGSSWALYAMLMLSIFLGTIPKADETSKWNQYCEILPLSRKTVATSYYVVSYSVLALAIILYAVLASIVYLAAGAEGAILENALLMLVISFLMTAFSLPLELKFGFQKAPIVQMILVTLAVGVALTVFGNGAKAIEWPVRINRAAVLCGTLLLTLVLVLVSWMISVRIYEHKEVL